ncbi:EAL domain-containing protein [Funiculus sociatus GB2-A5]|uniref:EAL domain-containing protein n=1 Tax=Funiculus sociatus GB2-A5 TaxID=2933946 RepID=A0ABV0JQW6_9CYAN|nr:MULTISPECIES: GGDEF domain-containing response regulator [unclassified Trichocoleus]MBD1905609.1 EAL domain-containing protein [Trichocoleus sp. FACHB-832]MBD2065334.1 EAL domain-containing protein [Trichocoleus sp. FACHB-6]
MKKILVIEDEEFVRYNILELLEAENFDATGAENGLIGVQMARAIGPDLIICDVMMPELDGYGVLKTLRQDPMTATIPFIFLSAKAERGDLRQGMELGADDYVTKPCTPDELLGAIAARLKRQTAITQPYTVALRQAAERLNHLLYYDNITNLPNRLLLRERFSQIIDSRERGRELDGFRSSEELESTFSPVSQIPISESSFQNWVPLLYLGLDRFNRINEGLGNQNSDRLIKKIAERITACLSKQDTIARLNADQFVIILATLSQRQMVASVAQAIVSSINESFTLESGEVFLSASIGIAFYPRNGQDLDSLMKKASAAMFYTQKLQGNNYQFYTPDINVGSSEELELEASLRRALEQKEFQVYYQPIVNLSCGKIIGAEALVRWQHPVRGMVSPAEFIPLAEETGLIVPLGEWVLQTACAQAQRWRDSGFSSFRVSVNLSGRQFSQPELSQRIVQILESVGVHPTTLGLELTESILVENATGAIATLNELKQLGIDIAIDDFGTGYASLSYLKQFPFDTLKIDRSFVSDVTSDAQNQAIMTAVIQLAHNLNLKVTAEGVETEAELAFLSQQQCDAMQGYLFSRPIPAAEMETMLFRGKRLLL